MAQYRRVNAYKYKHTAIAERALGKQLPKGAEVHHVNEDKDDNKNRNLVICQDRAYHALLHVRTRVLSAGGNPNTQRICSACKLLVSVDDLKPRTRDEGSVCRPCNVKSSTESHRRHRDKTRARRRAWAARKRLQLSTINNSIDSRPPAMNDMKNQTGGR